MNALRPPLTIDFREMPSIHDLLDANRPGVTWIYPPNASCSTSELLFPELANDEIRSNHYLEAPDPMGIGLACLREILVSGDSLVGTSSHLYRLGPLVPAWVDQYLEEGAIWPFGNRSLAGSTARRIDQPAVLLTHLNSNVYGHWLLEGLPKLLFLRRIQEQLPQFCIILPRALGSHVADWVRFVMPDVEIEFYDNQTEFLSCRTLLLPTLLCSSSYHFHLELLSLLSELPNKELPEHGGRIFLTREKPSNFRVMVNKAEIEAIAADHGLQLVSPEILSIRDQIALFASAHLIVGEFGSAMHNALFSPSSTAVFCLNWINICQSRIAGLKRQRVGYLLPSNGNPIKYVDGAAKAEYHIDPTCFASCLSELLQAPRHTPS